MEYNNNFFFDEASEFYNSMINSESLIDKRVKLFTELTIKNGIVADLGCGSGIDSVALSRCGNIVDAFDPSTKMIELAKTSVAGSKGNIDFHNFSIENIPEQFNEKYSFVCSLGNTIANIDSNKLILAFQKAKEILQSNGQALFHILNYDLILSKKQRIVNITSSDAIQFIRFYDFLDNHVIFNILKISQNNLNEHKLISTKLFPHTFETIFTVLSKINFSELRFYGGFNFEEFDVRKSKDLLISVTR